MLLGRETKWAASADLPSLPYVVCVSCLAGSLGSGCIVGPTLKVESEVPSHSVMFGGAARGVTQRLRPQQEQANIEAMQAKGTQLRDMIAKTHRLMQ